MIFNMRAQWYEEINELISWFMRKRWYWNMAHIFWNGNARWACLFESYLIGWARFQSHGFGLCCRCSCSCIRFKDQILNLGCWEYDPVAVNQTLGCVALWLEKGSPHVHIASSVWFTVGLEEGLILCWAHHASWQVAESKYNICHHLQPFLEQPVLGWA